MPWTKERLVALQPELDPDGSIGLRKIASTLTSLGLEPDDIEPGFTDKGPSLHEKVPKERAEYLLDKRKAIRNGLRLSRLEQVRDALETISHDDIRRYHRVTEDDVRPLVPGDLPPVDAIDGVAEIKALQDKQMARVAADQARKATAICTDFLSSKKRAEEADARVEAAKKRLKEYRQAQNEMNKQKRIALQKAEEKRQQAAAKAAQDRAEYEDKLEADASDRLKNARALRAKHYSTETLGVKIDQAAAKREAAFSAALELEERILADLQAKQNATEERLFQRNCALADYREQKRQEAQASFQQKQINVAAYHQEWAENKLASHSEFMKKCADSRHRGRDFMKDRSKSVGDLTRKAFDKQRANWDRLKNEHAERNADSMGKLHAATDRVENQLKPMKLKCGGDVFTHYEIKDKTFGDLQQRRWKELKKSRNAHIQALCIKTAEQMAKDAAKEKANNDVRLQRVEAAKEILRYQNEAEAVFLKIQAEPNEDKVRKAMAGLGFKMPRIGGEEDDDGDRN